MVRQLQLFHESETLIPPKLQQVLTKCLCSRSAFHRVYDRKGKSAYFSLDSHLDEQVACGQGEEANMEENMRLGFWGHVFHPQW